MIRSAVFFPTLGKRSRSSTVARFKITLPSLVTPGVAEVLAAGEVLGAAVLVAAGATGLCVLTEGACGGEGSAFVSLVRVAWLSGLANQPNPALPTPARC
jgi:hypothetical protein